MIRKDGIIIDVEISLSVLKNSEGRTVGSIGESIAAYEMNDYVNAVKQIQNAKKK